MNDKPIDPIVEAVTGQRFAINIEEDGMKIFLPDRPLSRGDMQALLEGIRDLIYEYNNTFNETPAPKPPKRESEMEYKVIEDEATEPVGTTGA